MNRVFVRSCPPIRFPHSFSNFKKFCTLSARNLETSIERNRIKNILTYFAQDSANHIEMNTPRQTSHAR